jgi:hypothetical protein
MHMRSIHIDQNRLLNQSLLLTYGWLSESYEGRKYSDRLIYRRCVTADRVESPAASNDYAVHMRSIHIDQNRLVNQSLLLVYGWLSELYDRKKFSDRL